MSQTIELPKYAFPYRHPAATKGDVGAEFRTADGSSVSVSLERLESGMLNLVITQSGLHESAFTREDMGKVLELAQLLLASNGKQPPRAG